MILLNIRGSNNKMLSDWRFE